MKIRERIAEIKKRYGKLVEEYGILAVVLLFVTLGVSVAGFYVALSLGWETESAAGSASKLGAAYLLSQGIKIPRIILVLFLTPIVGPYWLRWRESQEAKKRAKREKKKAAKPEPAAQDLPPGP